MIIEIGTSDFRTQAGLVDGVFIEPVKYYFDRMVNLASQRLIDNKWATTTRTPTHFENVAISDYEGSALMWGVKPSNLEQFPNWARGCVKIGEAHPSIIKHCAEQNLDWQKMIGCERAKVVRIKSIIDKYNITSLDLLKINTAGHDCIILNDYLNTVDILPKVIQFESNELSDPKEVAKAVARLKPLGYDCKQVKFDMVCIRQ